MTPFALLEAGEIEKAAYMQQPAMVRPPRWGTPQSSGFNTAQQAATKPPRQWGVINNTWGDLGASLIPVAGGVYMANKSIQDFRQGKIGSGIGNALWSALSFIPGGGLVRGAFGAIKGGLKGLGALGKAKKVGQGAWQGVRAAKVPGGLPTTLGAAGVATAAPMFDPQQQPQPTPYAQLGAQPNAYQTPTAPQSWIQMGRQHLQGGGY